MQNFYLSASFFEPILFLLPFGDPRPDVLFAAGKNFLAGSTDRAAGETAGAFNNDGA